MYFNRLNITWITFLAIFFFLSYGYVNHLSAYFDSLNQVQSIVFEWEKSIPFIPIFIYPYMSIDFLYGLAFFIIAKNQYTDEEYKKIINGLGLQLLINQIFSLICFLSFPLKFTLSKPDIPEQYKSIFDALLSFDLPYNQAPSLHISILIILTVFYSQHIKNKIIKHTLNVWFFLIGLSILFTFQHHFIDLLLGAFVGTASVLLFNYSIKHTQTLTINRELRKSSFYKKFSYSLVIISMALFIFPILNNFKLIDFVINRYIYIALLIAFISFSTIYKLMFFNNNFPIRNSDNQFTWFFLIVGMIYIKIREIFIYLLNYYSSPIKVKDNIYIGNLLAIREESENENKVFINLTWECDNFKKNTYSFPLVDLVIPHQDQLKVIAKKIDELVNDNKVVYIHCALGLFRTLMSLGAYLIIYEGKTINQVFDTLNDLEISKETKRYIEKNKEKFYSAFSSIKI